MSDDAKVIGGIILLFAIISVVAIIAAAILHPEAVSPPGRYSPRPIPTVTVGGEA